MHAFQMLVISLLLACLYSSLEDNHYQSLLEHNVNELEGLRKTHGHKVGRRGEKGGDIKNGEDEMVVVRKGGKEENFHLFCKNIVYQKHLSVDVVTL